MLRDAKYIKRIILSLLIIVPLGLLSKRYTGFGRGWVNDFSGDILYEIFWCLFGFFLFPSRKAINQIPIWVFGITCTIEFLQLWHQPVLDSIRSTFLGKLLLGTTFSWWDFPHYLLGCIIGWLWLQQIVRGYKDKTPIRSDK
ncbi:DUF2809 domain-containing protein [Trichocoleus sp. DQ-A3]|uniref:ribosomal maturation YjgA family protein n=1 Tax=Cyanophyceae TaxID=3028117 RepID=UPI0016894497|nr:MULTISPECIES: DUF2809 domain-containing protein [unclassified Coleofasciculus]MBD1891678.1 DUF2809 domain-containing protein [Coleofasciculus sp. FACHB-SPT9]MBD1897972.1 DUF2809 domain-containing protein [Coleofasciculus sp. FACHB-129]MBD1902842.1 DUF2809 domain-containing protein [Coleofasciculus sp. FACHB-125]MBD2538981.1 DUF2809 domain-containing protein [Coleofasciculus sp. FACHB-SPT36]